jgi:hypothetical protein
MKRTFCLLSLILILSVAMNAQVREGGDPKLSEVWQPEARVVTPGKTSQDAPLMRSFYSAEKIFLNGRVRKEGMPNGNCRMIICKCSWYGHHSNKKAFGDCQLHIEWRTPDTVRGDGQGRGNSGIFFMGLFELQVLDNFNNRTYSNGQAGSIYKQSMPLVNACRPPGQWQTYDVIFTAPRFNSDSSLKSPARITVFQNGILVQNNFSLWGGTEYIGIPVYQMIPEKLPLALQDHGNTVRYRNIWIREL